ncbi:ATP-binding protein [Flavobacterium sp. W20_MBD1_R3]|uniref:ATP-binding protein n=1 Tax=Flavobacterium sp. W20_MBD1_R3 TaxID=3240278 RepID=UPI003F8DC3D0
MTNILVFGKYESINNQQDLKPIDFKVFMKKLVNTYFSNVVHNRKINLKLIIKSRLILIKKALTIHVLTNLIDNALKYSTGKPDPSLIITYLESEIEIQVSDFGIGIPENEI